MAGHIELHTLHANKALTLMTKTLTYGVGRPSMEGSLYCFIEVFLLQKKSGCSNLSLGDPTFLKP